MRTIIAALALGGAMYLITYVVHDPATNILAACAAGFLLGVGASILGPTGRRTP